MVGVGGQGEEIGRGSLLIAAAICCCAAIWAPAALAVPGNNNYANAQVLPGNDIVPVNGSNVDAWKEAGEPDHAGNVGGASIWYSWTAPGAGATTIETCDSAFNTLLAVYTELGGVPPFSNLSLVAANDDFAGCGIGGNRSRVAFTASAGATYKIAVDGWKNPAIIAPAAQGMTHMRIIGQKAAPPAATPMPSIHIPDLPGVRRKCASKKRKRASAAKKKRRCGKKRKR